MGFLSGGVQSHEAVSARISFGTLRNVPEFAEARR